MSRDPDTEPTFNKEDFEYHLRTLERSMGVRHDATELPTKRVPFRPAPVLNRDGAFGSTKLGRLYKDVFLPPAKSSKRLRRMLAR
jgi:hypothetical protein